MANRASCAWNEYLNVMCEEGSDLLTLDVYDYVSNGREAIIGSASVELKHLFLGGFSDEWNEFSLRVDKESGAIVNFRCCFKPFVGALRYGADRTLCCCHICDVYLCVRLQSNTQPSDKPRDMFGFEIPSEKLLKMYKEITPQKLKQDLERSRALNRVYNWHRPKDLKDLKKFTRRGIPIAHRPEVWVSVTGARKKMDAHTGLYQKLLQENGGRTSAHTLQIDKDLHRTAGHHHVRSCPMLSSSVLTLPLQLYRTAEGRSALRRILVAYSWKNAGLGYCQSMNFIGAILLLFLDEEAVFWLLATIVEDLLPDYFTQTLHGVRV